MPKPFVLVTVALVVCSACVSTALHRPPILKMPVQVERAADITTLLDAPPVPVDWVPVKDKPNCWHIIPPTQPGQAMMRCIINEPRRNEAR